MRAVIALLLVALATPLAAATPEGDCTTTDVGVVCVGDYAWTEGDGDCQGDTISESGSGVWTETVAGHASASGFTYCNVYYDSSYHESGMRVRVDMEPVFLEVSWNTWEYDDPTQHLEGCSFWVYYIGPAYGYYNNVGCPAGQEPPAQPWGDLFS
jgi:hypothetical protein